MRISRLHISGFGLGLAGGPALVIWPTYIWVAYFLFTLGAILFFFPFLSSLVPALSSDNWVSSWQSNDLIPFRRLIPLKDAAQYLYEETHDTLLGAAAEHPWGDEASPIGYYANYFLTANVGPVYGRKEFMKKIIMIPPELLRGSVSDDANSLEEFMNDKPLYTDLAITKHDMKVAKKIIKSWGFSD